MTMFSKDGLSAITTKLSSPLMLDSYTSDMCVQSWFKLSYARAMIEPRTDEELKDTIVVVMPKLVGEGFYMCTIRVEYEWKPPTKCLSCKVFGHFIDKCPKNIVSDVVKNLKNPRQAVRGVQIGTKVDFKPIKQVYRAVSNRNDANSSGKKEASCGSYSTTPIVERIDKMERQNIDGKLTLVDDDGKLLPKVVSMANVDSDSEVKDAVDVHQVFMASTSLKRGANSGYGTNSLFEQRRTTKRDDDYDPYDDDLYESHDMSENLQAICDDIDITVHGRKKK
ncbi:putative reverse transcriptase domain-containing protein [Tanacetum coccineum]|uniref:Reverse transcriptase domain-containing protein n=1 Tax=Tanacetum coccineum TaxID=301880 RepID=A0ABQ5GPY3_9ASTR